MKEVIPSFEEIPSQYIRLTKTDWEMIQEVATGLYVEVGTFYGASASAALSRADRIISIDIYDWNPKIYQSKRATFFKGTSVDWVNQLKYKVQIDSLFIDGSHEFEYVLKDCEILIPLVRSGGFILFHDHNPDNPMTGVFRAVNKYLKSVNHIPFPKRSGTGNMFMVQKI